MKNYLLDPSDCSESPMLSRTKFQRHWDRRCFTDLEYVRCYDLRSRSHPKIEGLTEAFFNSRKGELKYRTNMEFLLKELSPAISDDRATLIASDLENLMSG